MKPVDIVLLLIILAAVTAAVVYMVKCRKKGKCIGCSGDCSSCGKNIK